MKKTLIGGALVAGMLVLGTGTALAGETYHQEIRDCVIEKASMELDEGQMALLEAHGDGEINILSTVRENNLNPLDGAKVHLIMWFAGTSCVLGG